MEKVDDDWSLPITLTEEEEGLADIIDVVSDITTADQGDVVNFTITVKNIGNKETAIFSKIVDEDTGEEYNYQQQTIAIEGTEIFSQSFIMPNRPINLRIDVGREEEPSVTFRQSWPLNETPSTTDEDWIAVCNNEDGILEGWGSPSSVGSSMPSTHSSLTLIAYDPLGKAVYYREIDNATYIYRGQLNPPTGSYQYWKFDEPAPQAETSSNPVEPYTSNGQETYS